MPNSARARAEASSSLFNESGGCPPYVTEAQTRQLIPTAKLSDTCRKVVLAWNRLPLPKKLNGLFPSLEKRLGRLLENYGEEQVLAAIRNIADSPFLLGKSKNNRGWIVSLNWMLNPENLEKILAGQYTDQPAGGSCLFAPSDELMPLPDGFMGTVVY